MIVGVSSTRSRRGFVVMPSPTERTTIALFGF
jgi:hypothetical protein